MKYRIIITVFVFFSCLSAHAQVPFKKGLHKPAQMKYPRVQEAYADRAERIKKIIRLKNLANDLDNELYFRIIKNERCLEVWTKPKDKKIFHWFDTYFFCSYIGELGPKLKEGDFQIPEGFYKIDRFNPKSEFHMSMGINYPNKADRIRSKAMGNENPGSDIFIHGSCVTVGCIPVGDELIQELYVMAVEAINAGHTTVPIHIFPFRLTDKNFAKIKVEMPEKYEKYESLWRNMQPAYQAFEDYYLIPKVTIDEKGSYVVKPLKEDAGYELPAKEVAEGKASTAPN